MNGLLTIAGLTIREAIRKKVFVASAIIAAIFFGIAMLPIHPQPGVLTGQTMAEARDMLGKTIAWLGCGMIKFFSSVLAVTLAAGSISAEVEKGVLSIIVPKPVSRLSVYLGKWLGLITMLAASVAVWGGVLVFDVWHRTGTFHPHIFLGILATFMFPLLFATLTLAFSSFASFALSAGLALIAAGVALAEDLLNTLSMAFNSSILGTVGKAVGYVVPLGRMNHWITRGLGDAGHDLSDFRAQLMGQPAIAATTADMVYIVCYILGAAAIGAFVFHKRDL